MKDNEQRLSEPLFYGIAALLVFAGYATALAVTNEGSLWSHALSSLRNLLPLALLTAVVRPILLHQVMKQPPFVQLGLHLVIGTAFALIWYWALMVLIGLSVGESALRFSVRPFFPHPAVAWQLLQGATFYALAAALIYMRAQQPLPSFVIEPGAEAGSGKQPSMSRYFIRRGDDIYPVDVSQIVSITGADDYAEVTTDGGRHLVRMTLADLEKALEGANFVRVHRSRIVNVDRIARAEPAGGGRVLLHMDNGETIQTSRAGAKLLKERFI